MAHATIRVPYGLKHQIVIPIEVWNAEDLKEGDIIEVEIKKYKKSY